MYWRIHLLCIAGMFKIFPVDYYVIVGAEEAGVTSRYGSGFTKIMRHLLCNTKNLCRTDVAWYINTDIFGDRVFEK
jgi:hypothetical protein